MPHADPDVLHKGFGSLRRPVANLLKGAILNGGPISPNAVQPELITVSALYIRPEPGDGKGRVPLGHTPTGKGLQFVNFR
jgi:hypothetical protein